MELPGAAWVALIVALTEWVRRWNVGGRWGPLIVVALGVVAKAIEIALSWPQMGTQAVSWCPACIISLLFG